MVEVKRDLSIDCVKGLAIIAIVLSHLHFYMPSIPENKIYLSNFVVQLWHVPVWFCIAGFFIKEERLSRPIEFIAKKTRTLYVKTILFYVMAVLLHNTFLRVGLYSEQIDYGGKYMFFYSVKDTVVNLFKAVFFMGREPIVGPLWFAYVLFEALCGYSLLTFAMSEFFRCEKNQKFLIKGCVILTMTIVSNILSQNFGITQNRASNVFPAMLLIYIGQWFNVERKMNYNSSLMAIVCFLLIVQVGLSSGGIHLNDNVFHDVFHLIVGGCAYTYLLLFLIKKCNCTFVKKILAFLGKYSFAIMALHLLCFKLCICAWNGIFHTSLNIAALSPEIGRQYIMGVIFLLISCFLPAVLGVFFEKCVVKNAKSIYGTIVCNVSKKS